MAEHHQQCAVFEWWYLVYPKYYEKMFSCPNGAFLAGDYKRRAGQMKKLKAEGLKPGVSDIFLMVARGGYHGLFIEMKDIGKTEDDVTVPQLEHIEAAREEGYKAEYAIGAEQAIKILDKYMKSGKYRLIPL